MSRKKNLLDYLALTLFIMCMGLALSASLEYVTRATEREYLGQGIWGLSMAGLSLLTLLLGVIVSLFSALLVTRFLMKQFIQLKNWNVSAFTSGVQSAKEAK